MRKASAVITYHVGWVGVEKMEAIEAYIDEIGGEGFLYDVHNEESCKGIEGKANSIELDGEQYYIYVN